MRGGENIMSKILKIGALAFVFVVSAAAFAEAQTTTPSPTPTTTTAMPTSAPSTGHGPVR